MHKGKHCSWAIATWFILWLDFIWFWDRGVAFRASKSEGFLSIPIAQSTDIELTPNPYSLYKHTSVLKNGFAQLLRQLPNILSPTTPHSCVITLTNQLTQVPPTRLPARLVGPHSSFARPVSTSKSEQLESQSLHFPLSPTRSVLLPSFMYYYMPQWNSNN